jgi:hypothetical protein
MELLVLVHGICALAAIWVVVCRRVAEHDRIRAAEQRRAELLIVGAQKFAEYSSAVRVRARIHSEAAGTLEDEISARPPTTQLISQ